MERMKKRKRLFFIFLLAWEFPHNPNLLKPPHHQQNQIKLPSLQASHIFFPQCVSFPHFPTSEVSQESPARKTPKTARTCSYKVHRSRSTHPKPTLEEKRENTHQQKRTNKQKITKTPQHYPRTAHKTIGKRPY